MLHGGMPEKVPISTKMKRYIYLLPGVTAIVGLALTITGFTLTFHPYGRLSSTSPASVGWFSFLLALFSIMAFLAMSPFFKSF